MSMTAAPKVSVLLPVHNCAAYIESALRSMMEQTLRDIEIVVVDDGSTDATPAILARLAAADPRIRILRPEHNLRLPRALNFGLEHVRGTYVARMDADDLSLPNRLARQAAYLDAHPDVILVGCGVEEIDGQGRHIKRRALAQDPFAVRWRLRFHLAFNHPTFMFRRTEMTARYDPDWTVSEDYDLQARVAAMGDCAALPDVLLQYRVHENSITGTKWDRQIHEQVRIATRVQRAALSDPVYDALDPFRRAYYGQQTLGDDDIRALFAGMRGMIAADLVTAPDRGPWMRRQAAQLLWVALWRSGMGKARMVRAFLRHGRDFAGPLVLDRLGREERLPRALRAEPQM